MAKRLARLALFTALRAVVMAAGIVAGGIGAILVDTPFHPSSSPDWGFGRLVWELGIGGGIGLIAGLIAAARLGRRFYSRHDRVLQCLGVVVLAALYMAGGVMEGSG